MRLRLARLDGALALVRAEDALAQAKDGRLHILGEMNSVLGSPRETMSDWAPTIQTFKIDPEKIRDVIGKGGSLLRTVGEQARAGRERFFGSPVYLDIRVKVEDDWQRWDQALDRLGF